MDFGNPREVLPISKSKSNDFRAEKVKVDGEVAGTDRNFDLPKVGRSFCCSIMTSAPYPSDMVYSLRSQAI